MKSLSLFLFLPLFLFGNYYDPNAPHPDTTNPSKSTTSPTTPYTNTNSNYTSTTSNNYVNPDYNRYNNSQSRGNNQSWHQKPDNDSYYNNPNWPNVKDR